MMTVDQLKEASVYTEGFEVLHDTNHDFLQYRGWWKSTFLGMVMEDDILYHFFIQSVWEGLIFNSLIITQNYRPDDSKYFISYSTYFNEEYAGGMIEAETLEEVHKGKEAAIIEILDLLKKSKEIVC